MATRSSMTENTPSRKKKCNANCFRACVLHECCRGHLWQVCWNFLGRLPLDLPPPPNQAHERPFDTHPFCTIGANHEGLLFKPTWEEYVAEHYPDITTVARVSMCLRHTTFCPAGLFLQRFHLDVKREGCGGGERHWGRSLGRRKKNATSRTRVAGASGAVAGVVASLFSRWL